MTDWYLWIDQARSADILDVIQSFGAKLTKTGAAEFIGPCPACGGTDRFSVNPKKRVFNCRGFGGGDVIAMAQHVAGCTFSEACAQITGRPRPDRSHDETPEERDARLERNVRLAAEAEARAEKQRAAEAEKAESDEKAIAKILDRAVAILASAHGRAYLQARNLNPHPRLLEDIRFVRDLAYWGCRENGIRKLVHLATQPAIVAIIRNQHNEIIGISQTYLDRVEPRKFTPPNPQVNSPRKIRGEKKGGLIRLGLIGETLGLGEGWENVLAWRQLGYGPEDVALAAAVDLGNLAAVNLPQVVRSVILVADNDSEPRALNASLRKAVERFRRLGLPVSIDWPPPETDWNDALSFENGRNSDARKLRV
jgi:phage/plasmid primase-like uncharacterized protein